MTHTITYRGNTHTFNNVYELAQFAWNTEKIDLLENVDADKVDMKDAVDELQKIYNNIEAKDKEQRQALADLFCDKELDD